MRRHVDPEGTVQLHDLLVNLHRERTEPKRAKAHFISSRMRSVTHAKPLTAERTFESGGIVSDSNTGRLADLLRADTAEAGNR